jgi:hypothetical protein
MLEALYAIGIIREKPTPSSVFHPSHYAGAGEDRLLPQTFPFRVAQAITRAPVNRPNEPHCKARLLTPETALLMTDFPIPVWASLQLDGHHVVQPHDGDVKMIDDAVRCIAAHHQGAYKLLSRYIKLIVMVDHIGGSAAEPLLTSCSIPSLPYCTFISRKAFVHLPPRFVYRAPSEIWLAENLVHEALHQALNIHILSGEVFSRDYDASVASRIPIPWRQQDPLARNREWPPDRALHALVVYVGVTEMRLALLHSAPLHEDEASFLCAAGIEGCSAMNHLASQIPRYTDCYTNEGRARVTALVKVAGAAAMKAKARFSAYARQ